MINKQFHTFEELIEHLNEVQPEQFAVTYEGVWELNYIRGG